MALTAKQKKYCQGRAMGKTLSQAFKDAGYGPNSCTKTLMQNADRMEKRSAHAKEIQAEIARLREMAEQDAILDRRQRQALLTEIALNSENDMPDRLRSLDQLNRMSGDYTDTVRTQVTGKIDMTFEEKLAAIQADMENETT